MADRPETERAKTAEGQRLEEARMGRTPWRFLGPYLSERQWGTVREDYSDNGDAWNYFSHDQARSRTYHWGEDGLAGFSDEHQRLCFSVALWNGKDPILKERLFGLTNAEGNHGEDVKEYYFYLDATPTHSYMKYLYKYPQSPFPYNDLAETNRRRGRSEWEYELLDTGLFNEDRYFDVFVEYAKAEPSDILIRINVCNRDRRARHCSCCRRSGTATLGHGGRASRNPRCGKQRTRTVPLQLPHRTPNWATSPCGATATQPFCSPKTRPTTHDFSAPPTRRLT
jgi:hypothetical protein